MEGKKRGCFLEGRKVAEPWMREGTQVTSLMKFSHLGDGGEPHAKIIRDLGLFLFSYTV